MKISKLYAGSFILVIAGFIAGCNNAEANKIEKKIVNVEVQKADNDGFGSVIRYSGTIEESESIPLNFSIVGNISRVYVKEGEPVRKGQLLAVLNDVTFKNANEISLAALKQAEDVYSRMAPMYKNGNLPAIKMVEIETGLQQARSAAAMSKKNLDDCSLYSPVSGIVGRRSIEPGMSATPGISAITIVKIEKVFARVSVPENEIAAVKKGGRAFVKVPALGDMLLTGIVEETGVMADPLSHTYKVKIALGNSGKKLMPGMVCDISFEEPSLRSEIVVPNQAVTVDENGGKFIYTADPAAGRAVRKYVQTGRLMRDGIEITRGLNSGELVVVSGQQKLTSSSDIRIINR